MSPARLFVAVWPPPEALDVLAAMPRPDRPGVRWTTREQWHVTLRFLGQADPVVAAAALGQLHASTCEAVLGRRSARLGRSALVVPVTGLETLADAVARCTATIGRPPDARPFHGHLTLARLKGAAIEGLIDVVDARWPVTSVALVASHLLPTGARYEVVDEVQLAPAVRSGT